MISSMDVKQFYANLSILINQPLISHKTLIFLDEVQEIDRYIRENKINTSFDLITLMKFLTEDGTYRFALSGSLLGVYLSSVHSWPTGYMSSFTMYPMDFEEFCWANGVNEDVLAEAKRCYDQASPLPDYLHQKLMSLFANYILVGGMPAAVKAYVETSSYQEVERAHADIEIYNNRDITKYAREQNRPEIKAMYDMLPEEISSKNKRFQVGLLRLKNHPEKIRDTFLWLEEAGLAIPVWNVSDPEVPLRASTDRNLCKLFHNDSGLLTYLLMDSTLKEKVLRQEKQINFGGIYENVVADLFKRHGFDHLYYYNSKKMGEVDFLLEKQGEVYAIEVKSGKDYARHVALNNLMEHYHIKNNLVFCNDNIKRVGDITYYPIYCAEFLHKRS